MCAINKLRREQQFNTTYSLTSSEIMHNHVRETFNFMSCRTVNVLGFGKSRTCGDFIQENMYIRLTKLIRQHFAILEPYRWFAATTCFGHETSPDKSSRADIRWTRLQTTLPICFVSTGTEVCKDLLAG